MLKFTVKSYRIIKAASATITCCHNASTNKYFSKTNSIKTKTMPGIGNGGFTPKSFLKFSVDGNISSGKSTLVSELERCIPDEFNYQVKVVPEPLEKWTDVGGHNLLGLFYKDPVKNGFLLQHYVQLTRLMDTIQTDYLNHLKEDSMGGIRIMERSLQNNRYCFVELAKNQGNLDPAQYAILVEWYNWLENNMDLTLDVIIYLRTSPSIVYDRMKSRGRKEESTVPINYLEALHKAYENWLTSDTISDQLVNHQKQKKQRILIVDANKSKEEVLSECLSLLRGYIASVERNSLTSARDSGLGSSMDDLSDIEKNEEDSTSKP